MSDTPTPITAGVAVFLSYAREDTAAAQRIAEALRAAGVEVWFDQSELRGGDAWDQKIRTQIKECALFLPVISANTQSRHEGYFRLEWRLADQRTHLMGKSRPFLVPVCIDATRDGDADVPDSFLAVQWTRLRPSSYAGQVRGDASVVAFCERVKTLLTPPTETGRTRFIQRDEAVAARGEGTASPMAVKVGRRVPAAAWISAAVVALAIVGWFASRRNETRASSSAGAGTRPPALSASNGLTTEKPAAPLTKAQQLIAHAQALYEPWDLATADDLKLADRLLKEATDLEPLNAEGWATLSILCYAQGSFGFDRTDARKELQRTCADRSVKLAPDSRLAKLALALRYRVVSTTRDDALRLLRELAARPDVDKLTLRQLGSLLRELREFDDALACYDRAAALPGGDPVALYLRGFVFETLGQFDQAEAAFDQALALRPDFAVACFSKLRHLIAYKLDLEGAKTMVQKMPARLLEDDRVAATTAIVWYVAHDADRAAEALQHITKDYIDVGLIRGPKGLYAGLIHRLAKRDAAAAAEWRGALRVIEQQLAQNATAPRPLAEKAHLHALLGEGAKAVEALRLFEQVSRLPPGRATVDTVSAYAGLGREEVVADFFAEVLKNGLLSRVGRYAASVLRFDPELDPVRSNPRFQAFAAEAERVLPSARQSASKVSAASSPAEKSAPSDKSIAVLAFANFGGDKENEYFSDGITEELLNVLAKVPGLRVAARTSAFYFKDKNVPIPEIAQKLNVAYVVEGSVQRAGDQVKITAQLIKADDGFHAWSETFKRDAKDVFAVEEEIAGLIAKQLSLKLGASSAAATIAVNPQALEFYLQANQIMRLRDTIFINTDRVEELLNRALALEPNFVRAQAMLAMVWTARGGLQTSTINRFGQRHSPETARIEAKVRQTIALDPTIPEAHVALAMGKWIWWDRAGAENELRTALSLNPSYASAHRNLGYMAMDDGRMDDAIAETKLAVQLDPFSQDVIESYARVLHVAGRYTEAIATYDRALALADSEVAREHKAYALAQHGQKEAALTMARVLQPESNRFRPFAAAGARVEADKVFPVTEPQNRAYYLLMLGRTEEGLAALDPAEMQSTYLHDVFFEPWFDPVREDPRFKKALETLGVTEAHARAQAWRKAHPAELPAKK